MKDYVEGQAILAADFAAFMVEAVRRNYPMEIFVVVDGQMARSSVCVGGKLGVNDPLAEYLANWACARKLVTQDRLERFQDSWGSRPRSDGDMPI